MIININGIPVKFNWINDASASEAKNYVDYVAQRVNYPVKSVTVTQCDDGLVDLDYELNTPKFERIRRITGYLTGTLDRWNNAKQAEERDRVKHDSF